MASLNKVILIGNLTADPELRQTQSGQSVSSFTVAVNRRYQKDGGSECDFINVVAWRERAEFVSRYFRKGSNIIICGSIQTRSYTTNAGEKRTAVEVVADEVSFGASKSENNAAQPQSTAQPAANSSAYAPAAYGTNSAPQFEEIPDDASLPF